MKFAPLAVSLALFVISGVASAQSVSVNIDGRQYQCSEGGAPQLQCVCYPLTDIMGRVVAYRLRQSLDKGATWQDMKTFQGSNDLEECGRAKSLVCG